MSEKQVIFNVTEHSGPSRRIINVSPTLEGIYRENGGEQIILAIAANCVRTIARRDGLERALE